MITSLVLVASQWHSSVWYSRLAAPPPATCWAGWLRRCRHPWQRCPRCYPPAPGWLRSCRHPWQRCPRCYPPAPGWLRSCRHPWQRCPRCYPPAPGWLRSCRHPWQRCPRCYPPAPFRITEIVAVLIGGQHRALRFLRRFTKRPPPLGWRCRSFGSPQKCT